MCVSARNAEVEFRHEQARAEIQCGSRNRRTGGNRRRARCCPRKSNRENGSRRRDSVGRFHEALGEEASLPIAIDADAERQLETADEWWQVNRTAAPDAIYEDFQSMARTLARNPRIGRRSTNTKKKNVRQVYLRRVGYVIYYRVVGSPPVLQILAFWHSRRGTGPPI